MPYNIFHQVNIKFGGKLQINHGYKTPKRPLGSYNLRSSGIVQLANSDALRFRNWSFTNRHVFDV